MIAIRVRGSIALALVVTCFAGTSAWGQESAPAETTPQAVLKSHDLVRSGSLWVLSAAETTVLKDWADARAMYQRVYQGVMIQQEQAMGAQGRKMGLEDLRARSNMLDQQILYYDQQINALSGPYGGNLVAQQRNQLSQERNVLVAESNQIKNMINSLQEQNKEQGTDQDQALQLNAEVANSREKYMQAVLDLRKSLGELTAKYTELAKNQDVAKVLEALTASTRSKQKLGPSAKIKEVEKWLAKAEGTVRSESIELTRENGVYHVYATLGKVPTKMVLDSGASHVTISAKLADRIGIRPKPGDQSVRAKIADGTEVEGKLVLIPSVRVGKFTIHNVECAVMPAEKTSVDPLLGQSFLKHFIVEINAEARKLSLKKVDTEGDEAEKKAVSDADAKPAAKASTKGRRPARTSRSTAKSKRSTQGRSSATGEDGQMPAEPQATDPN